MSQAQGGMTACDVIYPYECIKDFVANMPSGPKTIIKVGDQGYVYRFRDAGNIRRLKVSINGQAGFHYVTAACVKVGTIPAGQITIRSLDPSVAQIPVAAAASGQASLVERIFDGFLTAIRLQMLGSITESVAGQISTSSACEKMKRKILAGIPGPLLGLLNKNSFKREDLWELAQDEDSYDELDAVVYARMYRKNGRYLFYIGESVQPERRMKEHQNAAKKGSNYHYSRVKNYEQCKILKLAGLPYEEHTLKTGEQLFIMLFGNWPVEILQKKVTEVQTQPTLDVSDEERSSQIEELINLSVEKKIFSHRADALAFSQISKPVHQQTGWNGISNHLGVEPCNWSSPLNERSGSHEKLLWIKSTIPGVMLQFRRPALTLQEVQAGGSSVKVPLGNRWTISLPPSLDPTNLKTGTNIFVVLELMLNKHHPYQWARLPTIGPYEDWDDARSLGIRVEWPSPNSGWSFTYAQAAQPWQTVRGFPSVLLPYQRASAVVAGLRRTIYRDAQPWRENVQYRIKDAAFNHPDQAIEFRDLVEAKELPAPALKDKELLRSELIDKYQFNVALPNTVEFLDKMQRKSKRRSCDTCYLVGTAETPLLQVRC